jgi:hypothetical protein
MLSGVLKTARLFLSASTSHPIWHELVPDTAATHEQGMYRRLALAGFGRSIILPKHSSFYTSVKSSRSADRSFFFLWKDFIPYLRMMKGPVRFRARVQKPRGNPHGIARRKCEQDRVTRRGFTIP